MEEELDGSAIDHNGQEDNTYKRGKRRKEDERRIGLQGWLLSYHQLLLYYYYYYYYYYHCHCYHYHYHCYYYYSSRRRR